MELKNNYLVFGQQVSVDLFHSALPGHLCYPKRHTDDKGMFHGGCIFLDHASGYIQVQYQVTFSADETIKDKLPYKRDEANYGVCIQAYHTDNGVFFSKDFMDGSIEKDQYICFSGSGAANHNGVAEIGMQTVI